MTDPLSDTDFVPRWPWLGGDLQTLRNLACGVDPDLSCWPGERVYVALDDGDVLWATLHRPARPAARPLVLLVHGLGGSEDSTYVRATARLLLQRRFPVLRPNLRGAGPSAATCRGIYHAGASGDLLAIVKHLPEASAMNGLALVGFSLGGNMVLKLLGELGRDAAIVGAATVSAPLDLAATAVRFHRRRNRPYVSWLLGALKADMLAPGRDLSARERAVVAGARSIVAFDDGFVAPRHGFAGAADYYARASALPLLSKVEVPTLVVHALDDPWIAPEAYRRFDWRTHPAFTPLIVARGGHVGFHGRGSAVPWHDQQISAFLEGLGR